MLLGENWIRYWWPQSGYYPVLSSTLDWEPGAISIDSRLTTGLGAVMAADPYIAPG